MHNIETEGRQMIGRGKQLAPARTQSGTRKFVDRKFLSMLVACLALTFSFGTSAAHVPEDKMKPEELIAKHLEAIGPADVLKAAKSRVVIGDAQAISRTRATRDIKGVSQLASDGDKVLLAMAFDILNYPYEKAGFDGQKMTVALLEGTGQRTALGEFLMSQDVIFKQGLIGGALSSAWPLLDIDSKKVKLSYSGIKSIDNRPAHVLDYSPRNGSADMKITLFFDAETFRHVRTEYSYVSSTRMGARPSGSVGIAGGTAESTMTRRKLVEEFSDFKPEGGLMLPHVYKIRLSIEAQTTTMIDWVMNFSQFAFNQPIDVKVFNVAATR